MFCGKILIQWIINNAPSINIIFGWYFTRYLILSNCTLFWLRQIKLESDASLEEATWWIWSAEFCLVSTDMLLQMSNSRGDSVKLTNPFESIGERLILRKGMLFGELATLIFFPNSASSFRVLLNEGIRKNIIVMLETICRYNKLAQYTTRMLIMRFIAG